MVKNKFGKDIPEIKQIITDIFVRKYISKTLSDVLQSLGVVGAEQRINSIFYSLEQCVEVEDYELRAHQLLEEVGVDGKKITEKLSGRADLIYSQIANYLVGTSVLDLGCGDGKVGERIAKAGLEVTLADVYEQVHIKDMGLDFVCFVQGEKVPLKSKNYDITLLLTVMHHSDDPIATLNEAKRLTKKRGYILKFL